MNKRLYGNVTASGLQCVFYGVTVISIGSISFDNHSHTSWEMSFHRYTFQYLCVGEVCIIIFGYIGYMRLRDCLIWMFLCILMELHRSVTFLNIWVCMCSTGPFNFGWLKGKICSPSYYHHQTGSIHYSHCCHTCPWLCVWGGCTIIYYDLLYYQIIIKSEVWILKHSLELGHETMVRALHITMLYDLFGCIVLFVVNILYHYH